MTNRPHNLITGPIIYGMVIPLLMLDFFVTLYQWTCFPIYGINKVRRSDYLVFDRRHLGYHNFIEKFHCTYCEYGNGLMWLTTITVAGTQAEITVLDASPSTLSSSAKRLSSKGCLSTPPFRVCVAYSGQQHVPSH